MWIRTGTSLAQSSSILPPSCVAPGGRASPWVPTLGLAGRRPRPSRCLQLPCGAIRGRRLRCAAI
eukprot:7864636-Heterocapsa_arctica.AAC.1